MSYVILSISSTWATFWGLCRQIGTHMITRMHTPTCAAYLSSMQTLSGTQTQALEKKSNGVICYRRSSREGDVRKCCTILSHLPWWLAGWCVFGKPKTKNILKPLCMKQPRYVCFFLSFDTVTCNFFKYITQSFYSLNWLNEVNHSDEIVTITFPVLWEWTVQYWLVVGAVVALEVECVVH